eukprot:CAMPEP_0206539748 /NCGR_PEP_ID=MMETSP0325_2-20121206/8600_1 /ASSEMBLY_ACC=CAM_ASM_000347 /TAXON_ID=2866 /ORGANISM="Crypthecodinium cohnii, Strain Seligo" /LENGTH=575 /DNA_ID=CAMNT_0054037351 /DNA_START=290 /DNA_END=2016 /DNA_ORIENTATION=-
MTRSTEERQVQDRASYVSPRCSLWDKGSSDPRNSCNSLAVCDLVSFDGSEQLLRGVRLAKVMRGCGNIFRNSKGSASTYQLSESVSSITYFISHNWAIPRVAKYLSLAFKFNMYLAMSAGFASLALGFGLGIAGLLPVMQSETQEYPMGFATRMFTIPVILVTLLFGGDLVCWYCPATNPVMFLDKACIHQEDKALQRAGISKLGAFLRASDKMLVLLTPLYLRKLWTVYEVASFFSVHDLSKLEVLPVMLPIAFVLFVTLMYGYQFFMVAVHVLGVPSWIHWLVNYLGSLAYLFCLRNWARSKVEIQHSIANFSVHKANCAVESDRELVYQNITALQKALRASAEECYSGTSTPDEEVRTALSLHFRDVFGRFSFSQSEYFVIGIVVTGAIHVDHWAKVGAGQPIREAVGERSMDLFFQWFAIPLWALTLEAVAKCYLTPAWLSWKDICFTLLGNAFASCIGNALMVFQLWWASRAKEDDYWLGGAIALTVIFVSLRVYVINRYGSLRRCNWNSLADRLPAHDWSESTSAGEGGPSASSTNASLDPTIDLDCVSGDLLDYPAEIVHQQVLISDV